MNTAPPRDPEMVDRIEKLAQYVAQSNGAMEDTVRERQRTNPLFAFLFGGEGAGYYQECLRKYSVANNPPVPQVPPQGASIGLRSNSFSCQYLSVFLRLAIALLKSPPSANSMTIYSLLPSTKLSMYIVMLLCCI